MTPPENKTTLPRALTQKRLLELQARVESDFYDSPRVLERLADRLLDSGDLAKASD